MLDKLLKRKNAAARPAGMFDHLYAQAVSANTAGQLERALEFFEQAIALDSSSAEAFYKRGNTLKDLGRLPAAIASYDSAILLKPNHAHAYCNRGVVQQALGLTNEALSSYDLAIAHDPSDAMTHYNRALLLQGCSRWDEALQSYERAITADPGFADAQYNRALALLNCGDYTRGWASYEWRWKCARRLGLGEVRRFSEPLWLGEQSLAGKRIFLHSEAGLGDTLQFCRYASLLAHQGATVYLEVPRGLVLLLSKLDGVAQVIAQGEDLPLFDFHCPLLSLPLACKTTLERVPAAQRYLYADDAIVDHWRRYLKKRTRPRVGLVWSGNPKNTSDERRSIRLSDWVAHLPSGVDYYRLQRDVREGDMTTLASNPEIVSLEGETLDFPHVAALCECLDIVVSVDTSLAHLSAALGRTTWVLLSSHPDWRWLRDRQDSPWYPTVRLYRQKTAGEWREVFERVSADLRWEFRLGLTPR